MTTAVKIENTGCSHTVRVSRGGITTSQVHIHVWADGGELVIRELPLNPADDDQILDD